ncbi:uncharacterized protein LOC123268288 [Cotesia glomerata]|uniref:uncharacterized protein LOC123268288 n=1 Tax=Cotesia glomerata TaxID=32391 RepID=UPI001D0312DF|nr:uncharacterized protein LOC123268288 [Cotesia glomerata]
MKCVFTKQKKNFFEVKRMYPTARNFEGYGTWYQMVVMVYGERDIRTSISILKALARPINPAQGLLLVSWLLQLFGSLPPEVVEATSFLCLSGIEGVADSSSFEEVMCPNHGDLELMAVSLMAAVFNGLVTMP